MKLRKLLLYLSFTFLISCAADDSKIEFTFLQLNDVYEVAPIQGGKFGGMARVETLRQKLLKEDPNTLLFLAGDFLNPSLLGAIEVDGEKVFGKHTVEVMNAMNFDLVAFGNHEFDLPLKALQKRLNESNFPWISANVLKKDGEKRSHFSKIKNGKEIPLGETFIKEIIDADGTKIKIGFISVCVPSNPKDFVEYGDIFEKAKSSYNDIKDKVDIVFGLTHVKVADDKKIAKLIPNLPLIMGGHEHTNMLIKTDNGIIAKADANAKTVYIHKILYDKKTKKTIVKSELKEINSSIKGDEKIEAIVDKWQAVLNTKIKEVIPNPEEVIYTTKIPLDGIDSPNRKQQTNLGEVITKSMAFAFDNKVDCAFVNGGAIRIDDKLEGNINAIDIFRILPFGGSVLKVEIKGSLLKQVLDYGKKKAGTGAYLHRHNAYFENETWYIKGEKINLNKTYTVASSNFLLKGLDIPFLSDKNNDVISIYRPKETELAYDIRKAIIEYLKNETKKNSVSQ